MKIKQYYSWMVAAVMAVATPFLAACSSEENLAPSRGVAVTDAHIVINVEPYGATPTAAKSRAAEAPAVTKPDTVLLANGMRAVVSMEEDAPETQAATRATMDDGHYTIFALDPATGDRITGTKKQLTGTVTGGVFQSDAGSEMILDPGTYKFDCINDAVTDHGTWLEVNTGIGTMIGVVPGVFPTASDAQIGTSTETIDGDDWQVTFLMKHQNARFRLRLVAYTNQLENVVGALETGGQYPVTFKYALDGSTPVVTEKTLPYGYTIAKLTLPNTPAESNATYVKANNFYSNYMYVMPEGDDLGAQLGEGKAYGKSFNPAAPTRLVYLSFPSKTQRNHSYTITYRLLPEALYLFEDGSCGALAEKGSRTPIAVVGREKTNAKEGLAVALKNTEAAYYGVLSKIPGYVDVYKLNNKNYHSVNDADLWTDELGEQWTWESSGSSNGDIKANNKEGYGAFYLAAHYNPGVALTGDMVGKRWFFPAIGDWWAFLREFAADKTTPPTLPVAFPTAQVDAMFTNAGGVKLSNTTPPYIFSGNSASEFDWGVEATSFAISTNGNKVNAGAGSLMKYWTQAVTRPFIHF